MYRYISLLLATFALFATSAKSQSQDWQAQVDTMPQVNYASPVHKTIAGIVVTGSEAYDPEVLVNLSGLSVGQEVMIPGVEITNALSRFMRNALFANAQILATRYEANKVWLEIRLEEHPRIFDVTIKGIKKGDREDLEKKLGIRKGVQLTPNTLGRVKQIIRKHYNEKGYRSMKMDIQTEPNLSEKNYVNVEITIDRDAKTKVRNIEIEGNTVLTPLQLRQAMKKTNEGFSFQKGRWLSSFMEIFSQKKFVDEDYEADKENLLAKYREFGYRDAELLADTLVSTDKKNKIDIKLKIDEGTRYYIDSIRFVGNTKYSSKDLALLLGMKRGDVYNQKKLEHRLLMDEDAVANAYYNNGYLFASIDPVETRVEGDSVDIEVRVFEGKPATINRVVIKGNTTVYEDVVRRELFTKPGTLFSKEDIMNSLITIAQLNFFDPEQIRPIPIPNQTTGTVDVEYELVPRSSDKFQLSIGWSQTGLIGSVGVSFTNFSIRNLFKPSMYKGVIPQGDGQTLSINGQTNGRFYQAYSVSFMDPWFGGKRPNLLSMTAFYSRSTAIDERYYNNSMNRMYDGYYGDPYMGGYQGYGGYYGYGGYGGGYGGGNIYENAQDPDKSLQMIGLSIGYGKRLSWPDNWFQFYVGLNYTHYRLKNWVYDTFQDFHHGVANDINLELRLERNSVDNPIYARSGSQFSASVSATLPYSLFDSFDYSDPKLPPADRYRFIEYHKWRFMAKTFLPLVNPMTTTRTPVLMGRIEGGVIGHYNIYKRSPFGTYYMGGDMMSGYGSYMNETIGMRGYKNGTIAGNNYNYAYAYMKMTMELRYPILLSSQTNIWALAYLEAGNAWSDIRAYNPFNLKRSAGVGVRISLPMLGVVGVDWGYGFDRPDGSTMRGGSNVHFVLGQEF